jgi:anhydro-N-acetylmuramic acid kinase
MNAECRDAALGFAPFSIQHSAFLIKTPPMKETIAIGMMSGSSLDGLDIALVRFQEENDNYRFQNLEAETLPYPETWKTQLSEAFHKQPEDLVQLDKDYGKYLGEQVLAFAQKYNVSPDFVASHGHTIFHRPEEHYTLQIGDGQELAKACGFTVINDFRSEDVSKGGQGAPLVPIGDKLLFSDYEICLNIGGIANLSYDEDCKRIAYDLCIANQALNYLANMNGLDYDRDGELARSGEVDITLLKQLNRHPFYGQFPPKSLGREFFEANQKQLLLGLSVSDMLATFVEHIALQIALPISFLPKGKILCTGGGARNKFLIERLQARTKHEVVVPEKQIIDYKEALVFAFLGLLRLEGETNVLASVTGAESDSCSGRIWEP